MPSFPIVLNLIIVALLLLFVAVGWRRGLVMSLCSLLAVFVAFFGARFAAETFSPALEEWLAPRIATQLQQALEANPDLAQQGSAALLQEAGLSGNLAALLQDAAGSEWGAAAAQTLGEQTAGMLAYGGTFLAAFVLLLLLWGIFSRALDLVSRLPVLNFCNHTLGAVFGLVKGVLVLCVLGWALCDLTGLIPPETLEATWLLQGLHALFGRAAL